MELPKDVHYLIVKHLPMSLRIALKVKPGRVQMASEELRKTVERMAKVANHPNKLRLTDVRTDEGVEKMIVVHGWHYEGYIDMRTRTVRSYKPFQYYYAITQDRKHKWCLEYQREFTSFNIGIRKNDMFFYYEDFLKEYEKEGGPY